MTTKLLLIGVGGYGALYVRQILEAPERENVEIAGVVDPFAERSSVYSALRAANVPFYQTLEAFYAAQTADLAVISTPIHYHAEQAIACMRAGSHVLLEKPIAATSAQVESILEARDQSGKMMAVGYQWCWDKTMLRLRNMARAGTFGKPVRMRALIVWPRNFEYYSRGSGWAGKALDAQGRPIYDSVASNATAHYLFNMFWVAGTAPAKCDAQTYKANAIDTYDTAFLKYQLEGGGQALFIATHAAESDMNVNPRFVYEFERARVTFGEEDNHIRIWMDGTQTDLGPSNREMGNKLWHMVGAVRGEGSIPCTGEDAAMHLSAIEMARAAEPVASRFAREESDEERVWSPGLYEAAMKCYESFSLPREAGISL